VECGAKDVNNMKQMFKDMSLSHKTQEDFSKFLTTKSEPLQGVDFKVDVLTNGTWPQMEQTTCELPPQLKSCVDHFAIWFKQKN